MNVSRAALFAFPALSEHSFIFSSGGMHSHWNHRGFLSGNLLKAALGKIFLWKKTHPSDQAKS